MADAILFNVAASIVEKLGPETLRKEIGLLFGVNTELEKLKRTVSAIKAVLLDAEQNQADNHQVRDWLQKLQDAVYYADDLVDEFYTEALQRRVIFGSKRAKKVRIFFSSSNQLSFMLNIGHKIKEVREALNEIKDSRDFYLMECFEDTRVSSNVRETHSFVGKEEVIGRDGDKMAIVKLLLDSETEEDVSVIPIVGIGGLGKTALAQHIFNDENVQNHFELRSWVCVSDCFDLKLVVQKIIKSVTLKSPEDLELEQLQFHLRKEIGGKRYLLVLDDVWNEDAEKWRGLERLLMGGAKGSKVLVTTRSDRVAEITHTIRPYKLSGLDNVNSWSLFKRIAFHKGQEPENSTVLALGKEIVDKCSGVPLAIKTVGSILYFKRREIEWSSFKENELAKIPQGEDGILPTLKLSYNHLPSHLKHCFAYCRLFPKDREIDVQKLIRLWIAQGFIKPSDGGRCLEDVGYEYFMDLLCRSFFQDPKRDDQGNVKRFRIHDLMHDLAVLVAGTSSISIDRSMENSNENIRHVSFDSKFSPSWKLPPSLLKKNSIVRTFISPKYNAWHGYQHDFLGTSRKKLRWLTRDAILFSFTSLRTLDLKALNIKKLPNSLGRLKHLRYLDVSRNNIQMLPNSITRLQNLQTLILSHCRELIRLPEDMKKLVNLRHLQTHGCRRLSYMPRGIGELTALHSLDRFVVADTGNVTRHTAGLSELGGLNNLGAELSIENLGHGKNIALEVKAANFKDKQHLQSLVLFWRYGFDGDQTSVVENDEMSLDDLRPHSKMKALKVVNFMGLRFAGWLSTLNNLVKLELLSCEKCQHLPHLHELPLLKELTLYALIALEYISDMESNNQLSTSLSTPRTPFFPSLTILKIRFCLNLKGWWRRSTIAGDNSGALGLTTATTPPLHQNQPVFPCLHDLEIRNCPHLTSMPLFPDLKSLELMDTSFRPLQQTMMMTDASMIASPSTITSTPPDSSSLSKLKNLLISQIKDVESLPEGIGNLTSLQSLDIVECPKLTSLPEVIGNLCLLQSLKVWECPKLESLPEGLCLLTSLKLLKIDKCPTLSQRCMREIGEDWPKIAHIPKIETD
ncbi:Putative disease resistance protein RGA4 [Morus notabilis]|uniref:Putative disease resistance protein RGA4 n=1 Tax=Morus notabilis TaxID=981085 RepID=W9RDB1_9ROSA|nr:putative disease resistance protein RGA4 [Morus notabilis]EXB70615.1 Putative disease resistance protein RGA4 [Morus notabilis]